MIFSNFVIVGASEKALLIAPHDSAITAIAPSITSWTASKKLLDTGSATWIPNNVVQSVEVVSTRDRRFVPQRASHKPVEIKGVTVLQWRDMVTLNIRNGSIADKIRTIQQESGGESGFNGW